MKYTLEVLEAIASAAARDAETLETARRSLSEKLTIGAQEEDIIKSVRRAYLVKSGSFAASWALDNIPGFAVNISEAKRRVNLIIEDDKESGDATLDELCSKYRKIRKEHKQVKYTGEDLREMASEWGCAAQLIREGKQMQKELGIPEANGADTIVEIRRRYIECRSISKVAQWALDNIPCFAKSLQKAKMRVKWIVDAESSGDAALDSLCDEYRRENRMQPLSIGVKAADEAVRALEGMK